MSLQFKNMLSGRMRKSASSSGNLFVLTGKQMQCVHKLQTDNLKNVLAGCTSCNKYILHLTARHNFLSAKNQKAPGNLFAAVNFVTFVAFKSETVKYLFTFFHFDSLFYIHFSCSF